MMHGAKIYLDNSASTRISESVKNTIIECIDTYGNPSSLHEIGQNALKIVRHSESIIARKFNCLESEINFTSGATMSNNIFIQGFMRKNPQCHVAITTIEHNDIIQLSNYIGNFIQIPVNNNGIVNTDKLIDALEYYNANSIPFLFVCQAANGESGTIQDISLICSIVHQYKYGYVYCDATQYVPYYQIDTRTTFLVDGFGMSGQKIYCVKGTGILYVRDGVEIDPIIFGEQGLIGGTENVVGIAAIGKAIDELSYDNNDELINKRNYLIDGLKECGKLIGDIYNRLPNNVYMMFKKHDGESLVVLLDIYGICTSSGSACGSMSGEGSHVVRAMGYTSKESQSCVRFTLSHDTTYDELDRVIEIVNEIINFAEE